MTYAEMKLARRQTRHTLEVDRFKAFMRSNSEAQRNQAMLTKGYSLSKRKTILSHQDKMLRAK